MYQKKILIPSHHFSLPFLSSHFWRKELSGGQTNEKRKHAVGKKAKLYSEDRQHQALT